MLNWIFETYYTPDAAYSFIRVFQYITFRAALAAVMGFMLSMILIPVVIRSIKTNRFKSVPKEDVPFHKDKAGVPTLGGAVILMVTLVAALVCGNMGNIFVKMLMVVLVGLGAVGFLDDYLKFAKAEKGLYGRYKLMGQLIIAIIISVWIYNLNIGYRRLWVSEEVITGFQTVVSIPFMKDTLINLKIFYIPLAILIIVGSSNAVNLTDGLDGLAGGLSAFSIAAYAALAYLCGHFSFSKYLQVINVIGAGEITVVLLAMLGGLMGFLWYNAPPAEIYLGDTGALTIGGMLGTVAILVKQELLLILVGSVFVVETLSVIIQVCSYKLRGKRVFKMSPIHHHFELLGWAEPKIMIRFWILGIVSALMTLATLKLR